GHKDRPSVFLDVMHAHESTSLLHRIHGSHQSPFLSLIRRQIQRQSDHGFPRCSEKYRKSQFMHDLKTVNDFQVHLICLSESHAWVECNLVPADSRPVGNSYALS